MPEAEVEICQRVRAFRLDTKLTQKAFAQSLGIDSTTLGSIEHCRTPLRYEIARQMFILFRLNPIWLKSGTSEHLLNTEYGLFNDSNFRAQVSKLALFSDVFEQYLSKSVGSEISRGLHAISSFLKSAEILGKVLELSEVRELWGLDDKLKDVVKAATKIIQQKEASDRRRIRIEKRVADVKSGS